MPSDVVVPLSPEIQAGPILAPPENDVALAVPCAVVVSFRYASSPLLDEFFPGWAIVTPMTALLGRRFERIVMLWAPDNAHAARWVEEQLVLKLAPGRNLEWLV